MYNEKTTSTKLSIQRAKTGSRDYSPLVSFRN